MMGSRKLEGELRNPRVVVFLIAIILLMVAVIGLGSLGKDTIAAAFVGAGPPFLYYLYQEIVNRPRIVKSDDGVQYTKLAMGHPFGGLYPIIQVYVTLENRGKTTAKNCFSIVDLHNGISYFGRWGEGINLQKMDLHPGQSHRMVVMRFYPSRRSGQHIKRIAQEKDRQINIASMADFPQIRDVREGTVSLSGLEYHAQGIYDIRQQEGFMDRYDFETPPDVFFGISIEPQTDYQIALRAGSESWSGEFNFDISIGDSLSEGEWERVYRPSQLHKPFRELMEDEFSWKDI